MLTIACGSLAACVGDIGTNGGSSPDDQTPDGVTAIDYLRPIDNTQWVHSAQSVLGLNLPTSVTSLLPELGTAADDPYQVSADLVFPNLRRVDGWRDASEAAAHALMGDSGAKSALTGNSSLANAESLRPLVVRLGRRLFRRELTTEEANQYISIASKAPPTKDQSTNDAALEAVLSTLLQSPHFLYNARVGASDGKATPFELAGRLAWVLWADAPDDALLDAAASGALTREQIANYANRMLSDERTTQRLTHFFEILLDIDAMSRMNTPKAAYLGSAEGIQREFIDEAHAILRKVVVEDGGGLKAALLTDKTFATKRVASVYGLDGEPHAEWATASAGAWLTLPADRAGILTRAGWLTLKAEGAQSNPIFRGVFVSKKLLCQTAKFADPGAARIENAKGTTTRERTAAVTTPCGNGCHQNGGDFNAMGFAFENFDGYGRFRTTDNGAPADASGDIASLGKFANAREFSALLAESDTVHQCFAKQFVSAMAYRPLNQTPAKLVSDIAALSRSGASPRDLLRALITHPDFWAL